MRSRTLSIGALIAAITIIGIAGIGWGINVAQRSAIENRYRAFQSALAQKKVQDAYLIMSPDYRRTHDLVAFTNNAGLMDAPPLSPEHSLRVYWSSAHLFPSATPTGLLELWSGNEYEWVKVDGQWYMTGEYIKYLD